MKVRNLLFLSTLFALFSAPSVANAQEAVLEGDVDLISSRFTTDGKPRVALHTDYREGNGDCKFTVYDSKFNVEKTITIPQRIEGYSLKLKCTATKVEAINVYDDLDDAWVYDENGDYVEVTTNSLLELYLAQRYSADDIVKSTDAEGHTIYYELSASYYDEANLGKKYPYYYHHIKDGHLYTARVSYGYTGLIFEELGREAMYTEGHEDGHYTWDGNYHTDDWVYLSQNIFNNDDNYEYIRPLYSGEFREGYLPSYSSRAIDTVTVNAYYDVKGIEIVNDLGEVKAQVNCDYDDYIYTDGTKVLIMDGEMYLMVDGESANYIYKIDRETSSVKEVQGDFKVSFSPRVARRSQDVTVSLDAPAKQTADLVVTSMDGRVVAKRAIRAGQQSVQVNTARMSSGLYNFTVSSNGKKIENGKIIVK